MGHEVEFNEENIEKLVHAVVDSWNKSALKRYAKTARTDVDFWDEDTLKSYVIDLLTMHYSGSRRYFQEDWDSKIGDEQGKKSD